MRSTSWERIPGRWMNFYEGIGRLEDQDSSGWACRPKGILYGCLVINKYRTCGKTGVGSTLAQKNMLGIAVRGEKGFPFMTLII